MFSTTFRYGLITLLELAGSDELLQAGTIAARHNLSPHYLAVVLADLRRLGLVSSQKGKKGGYRLHCDPQQVTLLVLYQSLAGSAELPPSDPAQTPHPPAGQRGAEAWLQAFSRRWSAELQATTLADLQAWDPATDPSPGRPLADGPRGGRPA